MAHAHARSTATGRLRLVTGRPIRTSKTTTARDEKETRVS